MTDQRPITKGERQAEDALKIARDIHALAQMPGWATWRRWVDEGIESRRELLCQIGLDERTSDRLRGDVALLRNLALKADAALDIEKFAELEKELRGLKAQADARHYVRAATQGSP